MQISKTPPDLVPMNDPNFFIHPTGAYIKHGDTLYYPDGFLVGEVLEGSSDTTEQLMPTLWSMMIVSYQKKPEDVQAVQLSEENVQEVARWCGGEIHSTSLPLAILIPTLDEKLSYLFEGEYLVKGADGKFKAYTEKEFFEKFQIV